MSSEQKIMQCHLCKEHCPQAEMASKIANGRMFATKELIACQKELEQYRAIGTPEECMAAVEKQKSKKMVIKNDNGRPRSACGGCGCFVLPASRFCSKCGQKLDWSDEE